MKISKISIFMHFLCAISLMLDTLRKVGKNQCTMKKKEFRLVGVFFGRVKSIMLSIIGATSSKLFFKTVPHDPVVDEGHG